MSESTAPTGAANRHLRAADLEAIAVEAASAAAEVIRVETGTIRAIRMKSTPTDPVTHLDLEAERVVREVLTERTPDASVLGEEVGGTSGSSTIGWVIDHYQLPRKLTHLVLVNGVYSPPEARDTATLREGDVLAVSPPIAGG